MIRIAERGEERLHGITKNPARHEGRELCDEMMLRSRAILVLIHDYARIRQSQHALDGCVFKGLRGTISDLVPLIPTWLGTAAS